MFYTVSGYDTYTARDIEVELNSDVVFLKLFVIMRWKYREKHESPVYIEVQGEFIETAKHYNSPQSYKGDFYNKHFLRPQDFESPISISTGVFFKKQ